MAKDKEGIQSDKEEEHSDKKGLKDEEELKPYEKNYEKFEFEIPVVPLIVGGVLLIVFAEVATQ